MAEFGWNLDAERDIWRAVCAPNHWYNEDGSVGTHPNSLWWFLHLAWGAEFFFRNNRRWAIERVHGPYLRWLQKQMTEWKASRRRGENIRWYVAVIIPRAFGKTMTATKCGSLWSHLDEPDMSTIFASATSPLSVDILDAVKAVMSSADRENGGKESWFCWLYGDWKRGARDWTQEYIKHAYRRTAALSEPSFDTTAADVGMTGYHPMQAWWDDPLVANKLRDDGKYLDNAHTAFNATYPALSTEGWFAMVLTRYLDADIAGKHLVDEGVYSWDGMDCPNMAFFEKHKLGEGIWRVYFLQAEDELTGKAVLPEVMNEKEIARAKSIDPADFACQYQNNPGTSDRAPILEWQIRKLFVDYTLLRSDLPIEDASVHIDTAFKNEKNVKKGDYSAIVTYLHDSRPNGIVYIHTDLMRASNEWRSEEFTAELVKVLQNLRRSAYRVKCVTDEKEMGGKEGTYVDLLKAAIKGSGVPAPGRFHTFNRQGTNKRARIRRSVGFWSDGYVRILLHKDAAGEWIIPPVVRKLIREILYIDVVEHDDLADAAADVWQQGIWRRPNFETWGFNREEGMPIRAPGDEELRALSRPLTNDEVKAMMAERDLAAQMGPGHGPDTDYLPDDEALYGKGIKDGDYQWTGFNRYS